MTRSLAAVALLALPAAASAQQGRAVIVGPPIVGGRAVTAPPITNGPSALFPVEFYVPPRFSPGGGSMGELPKVYVPSGAWSTLKYQWPIVPVVIVENAPRATPTRPKERVSGVYPLGAGVWSAVNGEASATLMVEFPATAELWVDGQKRNKIATEWALTSPALKAGESHTFEVRGRWKAGGKTYEATRSVTVKAGDRNRVIIISGTATKGRPAGS